jgi:hypothetical protein
MRLAAHFPDEGAENSKRRLPCSREGGPQTINYGFFGLSEDRGRDLIVS